MHERHCEAALLAFQLAAEGNLLCESGTGIINTYRAIGSKAIYRGVRKTRQNEA